MDIADQPGSTQGQELEENPKQPYHTPQLIVYGTVEQITAGIGTLNNDGLTGSRLL